MSGLLGEIRLWRLKADELRLAAHTSSNSIASDSLLDMAEGYDQLADRMERLGIKRHNRLTEIIAPRSMRR